MWTASLKILIINKSQFTYYFFKRKKAETNRKKAEKMEITFTHFLKLFDKYVLLKKIFLEDSGFKIISLRLGAFGLNLAHTRTGHHQII